MSLVVMMMMIFLEDGAVNDERLREDLNWEEEQDIISRLTCISIVGIEDPVRPEVSVLNQSL